MLRALLAITAVALLSITAYLARARPATPVAATAAVVPPPPPPPAAALPPPVAARPVAAPGATPADAPAPINQDPRINRDRVLGELRASGRGESSRAAEAQKLIDTVRTEVEKDGDVRLGNVECYRAGCVTEATFSSSENFFRRAHALGQSTKDRWSGALFLSGPET